MGKYCHTKLAVSLFVPVQPRQTHAELLYLVTDCDCKVFNMQAMEK